MVWERSAQDEMVSARCRDGRRLLRQVSGRARFGKQRGRQRVQGSAMRGPVRHYVNVGQDPAPEDGHLKLYFYFSRSRGFFRTQR